MFLLPVFYASLSGLLFSVRRLCLLMSVSVGPADYLFWGRRGEIWSITNILLSKTAWLVFVRNSGDAQESSRVI